MNKNLWFVFLIFTISISLFSSHFLPIESEKLDSDLFIYINSLNFINNEIEIGDELAVFKITKDKDYTTFSYSRDYDSYQTEICLSSIVITESVTDLNFFRISKNYLDYNNFLSLFRDNLMSDNSRIIFKFYKAETQEIFTSSKLINISLHDKPFKAENEIFIDITIFNESIQVKPVQFSHTDSDYNRNIAISMFSDTFDSDIFYTIDGSEPNQKSLKYGELITSLPHNKLVTLRAKAFKNEYLPSETSVLQVRITLPKLDTPTLEIKSGKYNHDLKLKIDHNDFDVKIYYTIDGSEPDEINAILLNNHDFDYIDINETTRLKLKAFKDDFAPSETVVEDFFIDKDTHFVRDMVFSNSEFVSIFITDINISGLQLNEGDEIAAFDDDICVGLMKFQSINDSLLTFKAFKKSNDGVTSGYSTGNPIVFKIWDSSSNIELIENLDFKTEYMLGQPYYGVSETQLIKFSDIIQLDPPVFSHQSGIYNSAFLLEISHSVPNVSIYYTLDGTEPDIYDNIYTTPIVTSENSELIITAKAFKKGYLESVSSSLELEITGTVLLPQILPIGGAYQDAIEVTIHSSTDNSVIFYTLDGSEPDSTKTIYESPFILSENATVKAIAYRYGWNESDITSKEYFILNTPQNLSGYSIEDKSILTWEPPYINHEQVLAYKVYRNIYSDTEFIEIAHLEFEVHTFIDSLLNAGIYDYKVKAIYQEGESDFSNSQTIQINQVSPPLFSPPAGYHTESINVNIFTVTDSASIYYTIDGSNPDKSGILYTELIEIPQDSTLVIKAIAYRENFKKSQISTVVFTVTGILEMPLSNYPGGIYYEPIQILLETTNDGTDIRYTLDNTEPNENSFLYVEPFIISQSCTLKAKAFKNHWQTSEILEQEFLIVNLPGSFNITTYNDSISISWDEPLMISNSAYNPDNIILTGFKLFRKKMTENEFIQVNDELITDYFFTDTNLEPGSYDYYLLVLYDTYSVLSKTINAEVRKVDNLEFNIEPGYYYDPINIELFTNTVNAEIYYTLDGSEPTQESLVYNTANPIKILNHSTVTINAKAFYDNYIPSDVISGTFNVTGRVSKPVFNKASGIFEEEFYLIITSETENALIFYTLDGTNPDLLNTGHSTKIYTEPILILQTTTIKAISTKASWKDSEIVSVHFEIISHIDEVPEPQITTKLFNAYPNPFNAKTNVPYSLDKQSTVEIEIYNLLGQKITTLVSESKSKGDHLASWNGRDDNGREVAGGVYFCRMRTPTYTQMIKLVYVK